MVFHEFFFKSSVGDTQWKISCLEEEDYTARIAPHQGEAFAMILLKNNYFAWLWENKLCYKDLLVTDHNTERERNGKLNIGDAFLKLEINLEPMEANEGEDEEENDRIDPSLYTNLLVKEGDTMYRDLQKKTEAALKRVRQVAKDNRKYKELKKLLQQAEEEDHQRDDIVDDGLVEHHKKRRKVLKTFPGIH